MKTLCHRRSTLNKTNDSTTNAREIEDPSFDPRHTSDKVFDLSSTLLHLKKRQASLGSQYKKMCCRHHVIRSQKVESSSYERKD